MLEVFLDGDGCRRRMFLHALGRDAICMCRLVRLVFSVAPNVEVKGADE